MDSYEENEEIDEQLEYDRRAAEDVFSRGIQQSGSIYLRQLEVLVDNDSSFSRDDLVSIRSAFSDLGEIIGDGGEQAFNKISLS